MGKATPEALALYRALQQRGIKCQLETWDGHKHIDLCISWARMDIEIDGFQHYTNAQQIESDLERSYYSAMNDDFYTMHIPNIAIHANLEAVANGIAKTARKRYYKKFKNKDNSLIIIVNNIKNFILKILSNF